MRRPTNKQAKRLGRKGGKATVRRHGKDHMREIGRKGFMVTVAAHWQGDKKGFMRWLHARANHAVTEGLAAIDLAEQIESGSTIAITEIPVLDEEPPL